MIAVKLCAPHCVNHTDSLNAIGKVLKYDILLGLYGFCACRGDVIIHPPGLVVILKWTNTSQTSCNHHLVSIPEIKGHSLSPVNAYHDMVTTDQPLLLIPRPPGRLTTSTTRTLPLLQGNTSHSGIQPKRFTSHRHIRKRHINISIRGGLFTDPETWFTDQLLTIISGRPRFASSRCKHTKIIILQ